MTFRRFFMSIFRFLVAAALALAPLSGAHATPPAFAVNNFPSSWAITAASLPLPTNAAQEAGGNLAAAKADLDTITTLAAGTAGILTQTAVTVGTSSTAVLAAAVASTFIKLKPALTGACGVWVRWDGGVATAAPPAEYVAPGESASWIKSTGFLPTSAVNAIATASCPITVEYN
jgi:hypothetical protein